MAVEGPRLCDLAIGSVDLNLLYFQRDWPDCGFGNVILVPGEVARFESVKSTGTGHFVEEYNLVGNEILLTRGYIRELEPG